MTPEKHIDQQVLDYVREILAGNDWAWLWTAQLREVVLFWDQITDADVAKVDRQQLDKVMENVLINWVYNPFYQQHKAMLTPVMVNALSAWRSSNAETNPKIKAYDILTEVTCTLCMIIGGLPMVDKYMPKLRALTWEMCQVDDAADNNKR